MHPYMYGINMFSEDQCVPGNDIGGGTPCTWSAKFHALLYNAENPTYNWSTSLGVIDDNTLETIVIRISSDVEEDFDVTCVATCMVDGSPMTHSITKSFTTTLLPKDKV